MTKTELAAFHLLVISLFLAASVLLGTLLVYLRDRRRQAAATGWPRPAGEEQTVLGRSDSSRSLVSRSRLSNSPTSRNHLPGQTRFEAILWPNFSHLPSTGLSLPEPDDPSDEQ